MNQSFTVALDRRPSDCNVEAMVGDQFAVAVTFYETDGGEAPADLAGAAASLEVIRCCTKVFTVAGAIADGVATFDLSGQQFDCIIGRSVLRVTLTRAGRVATVVDGAFTVRR